MTWNDFSADYEIIGSTINPTADALPLRLMPVYKKRGESSQYYMSIDSDGDDAPPTLISEDAEWVRDQLAVVWEPAITPKKGYWLMQFDHKARPEYLPQSEIPARLQTAYEDAVRRAELLAAQDELVEARKQLFFASRAHPSEPTSEPLPQLALIPFLRLILAPEDLAFSISDINTNFSKERIYESLEMLRAKYPNLWRCLKDDPALPSLGATDRASSGNFLDRLVKKDNKHKPPRIATLRSYWGAPHKVVPQQANCAA